MVTYGTSDEPTTQVKKQFGVVVRYTGTLFTRVHEELRFDFQFYSCLNTRGYKTTFIYIIFCIIY